MLASGASLLVIIPISFMCDSGTIIMCCCEDSNATCRITRRTDVMGCGRANRRRGERPSDCRDRHVYLVRRVISCNRVYATPSRTGIRRNRNGLVQPETVGINDPKLLQLTPGVRTARSVATWDEVVAVPFIEPDLVSASDVRQRRQYRSAVSINDGDI